MKLWKIITAVLGAALLLNSAVNVWAGNYVLAVSEATAVLWMVAWWFARALCEILRPLADRDEAWWVNWNQARRWLAEFPDAADALDYVRREVDGVPHLDLQRLRDNMRARRDEQTEMQREQGARQMATSLRDMHGNLIAGAIVQFFDEWKLTLPQDAHDALCPLAEKARAMLKKEQPC